MASASKRLQESRAVCDGCKQTLGKFLGVTCCFTQCSTHGGA